VRVGQKRFVAAFVLALGLAACSGGGGGRNTGGSGSEPAIALTQVLTGLTNPVGLESARDGSGRMFAVEQTGRGNSLNRVSEIWSVAYILPHNSLGIIDLDDPRVVSRRKQSTRGVRTGGQRNLGRTSNARGPETSPPNWEASRAYTKATCGCEVDVSGVLVLTNLVAPL
jgi:hypothetical protein